MSHSEIIRMWKDEDFRASMSESAKAKLPAHPAGLINLSDADLDDVAGGGGTGNWACSQCLPCSTSKACTATR